MLKNPIIINWAQESLVRAGAAVRCLVHDTTYSTGNDAAVRRAVTIGRLNPLQGISANGTELALLETYLSLSVSCPHCRQQIRQAKTKRVKTI
jgi:hypothetical protein